MLKLLKTILFYLYIALISNLNPIYGQSQIPKEQTLVGIKDGYIEYDPISNMTNLLWDLSQTFNKDSNICPSLNLELHIKLRDKNVKLIHLNLPNTSKISLGFQSIPITNNLETHLNRLFFQSNHANISHILINLIQTCHNVSKPYNLLQFNYNNQMSLLEDWKKLYALNFSIYPLYNSLIFDILMENTSKLHNNEEINILVEITSINPYKNDSIHFLIQSTTKSTILNGLMPGSLYNISAYPCYNYICLHTKSLSKMSEYSENHGKLLNSNHMGPLYSTQIRLRPLPPKITFYNLTKVEGVNKLVFGWEGPSSNESYFDAYSIHIPGKSPLLTDTFFTYHLVDLLNITNITTSIKVQCVSGFWLSSHLTYSRPAILNLTKILKDVVIDGEEQSNRDMLIVKDVTANSFVLDCSFSQRPLNDALPMQDIYFLNVSTSTREVEVFFTKPTKEHLIKDLKPCTQYNVQLDVYRNNSLYQKHTRLVYTPPLVPVALVAIYQENNQLDGQIKFSWESGIDNQADTCAGKTIYELRVSRQDLGKDNNLAMVNDENSLVFKTQISDLIKTFDLDSLKTPLPPCMYLLSLARIMIDVEKLVVKSDYVTAPFTIAPIALELKDMSGFQSNISTFVITLNIPPFKACTQTASSLVLDVELKKNGMEENPLMPQIKRVPGTGEWIVEINDLLPGHSYECFLKSGFPWLSTLDTVNSDKIVWSPPLLASWTMAPIAPSNLTIGELGGWATNQSHRIIHLITCVSPGKFCFPSFRSLHRPDGTVVDQFLSTALYFVTSQQSTDHRRLHCEPTATGQSYISRLDVGQNLRDFGIANETADRNICGVYQDLARGLVQNDHLIPYLISWRSFGKEVSGFIVNKTLAIVSNETGLRNEEMIWIGKIKDSKEIPESLLLHLCSGMRYRFEVYAVQNGVPSLRLTNSSAIELDVPPICSSSMFAYHDFGIAYTQPEFGFFQFHKFVFRSWIAPEYSFERLVPAAQTSRARDHPCHVIQDVGHQLIFPGAPPHYHLLPLRDLAPGSVFTVTQSLLSQGLESPPCEPSIQFSITPQTVSRQSLRVVATEHTVQLNWLPPAKGFYDSFIIRLAYITNHKPKYTAPREDGELETIREYTNLALFRVMVPPAPNGKDEFTYLITDLRPSCLYSLKIISVSNGSLSRPCSLEVKTKTLKPGLIRELRVSNVKPYQLTLSWEMPESNYGLTIEYRINVTQKDGAPKTRYQALLDTVYRVKLITGLTPGRSYEINVQAKSFSDDNGLGPFLPTPLLVKLPIWPPPPASANAKPKLCLEDANQSSTSRAITETTLRIRQDLKNTFSQNHGPIQKYALIVREISIDKQALFDPSPLLSKQLDTWARVRAVSSNTSGLWPPYVAAILKLSTSPELFHHRGNTTSAFRYGSDTVVTRLKRSQDTSGLPSVFVIGENGVCDPQDFESVCNGPLRPGHSYRIRVRGFTTLELYADTPESEPMTTLGGTSNTIPTSSVGSGLSKTSSKAILIASLWISSLSLVALTASIIWNKRKLNSNQPPQQRESFNFENSNYDFGQPGAQGVVGEGDDKLEEVRNSMDFQRDDLATDMSNKGGATLNTMLWTLFSKRKAPRGRKKLHGFSEKVGLDMKVMISPRGDFNKARTRLVLPGDKSFKDFAGSGLCKDNTSNIGTKGGGDSISSKPMCSVPPCPNGFPSSRFNSTSLQDTKNGSLKESLSEDSVFCPERQIITLDTFQERMRELSADGDIGFAEEFDELRYVGKGQSCLASQLHYNCDKNRFTNILPYDHSRVKLLPLVGIPGSDYINSNFIPGFNSKQEYIAAQGPLAATCNDFWRMIWEQNSRVVIMLTKFIELGKDKCVKYWPVGPNLGVQKQYGDLLIELTEETCFGDWKETELKVSLGTQSRFIKHFHFTSWPDFGIPENPETLLRFIEAVRAKVPYGRKPLIIHCSAGVGRTGTFICVDQILQQIASRGTIDVYGVVKEMRKYRMGMIQNDHQYTYLYQCIERHIALLKERALEETNSSPPDMNNQTGSGPVEEEEGEGYVNMKSCDRNEISNPVAFVESRDPEISVVL